MPRKLKVFRMPVGFEDAYVAAPSRAAALRAWGTGHDQFARGVAEEVTDPALMAEPLARPGEVVRKSRGDLASQLKALGSRAKPKRQKAETIRDQAPSAPAKKPAKAKPPPKRDKVDAAEARLKDVQRRHDEESARLEAERAAIDSRIEALRARQSKELVKLQSKRDEAREAYRQALERWSG